MSADRQRVEALLARAAVISNGRERAAYLDGACDGDAELRREVESLLAAHEEAGAFLENSAPGARTALSAAGHAEAAADEAVRAPSELPGDRIGRYKLLEQIGEGGMGVVWMAEQEEPVRRRVALKIIKLGMDTRSVIARFEAERQALALMDHPNIAKVFDGGVTDRPLAPVAAGVSPAVEPGVPPGGQGVASPSTIEASQPDPGGKMPPSTAGGTPAATPLAGRPYFVMELVRGLPITKYCDETKMSTRDRLELFGKVCRAVQHAHQKGIIHRDLKPSNILVTEQDGRAVPKVIDFGIAKATEGRLTDKTLFTGLHQLIGTPAYMSPEQAGLGSLDVDTRSDTYSLGVVLYELLTGRPPFDTKELLKSGLEAVLRTIREVDPPKPSMAVERRSQLRFESPDARGTPGASTLNTQLKLLSTALRGDLDWIVMKCLEKDRNRRYDTPNALSLDLERYLHDEPVTACPPSVLYRWQKFAHKHRVAVGVAAGFFVLLTAAAAVSTALAFWANRERTAAQQSDADTKVVVQFFDERVLAAARPEGQEGGLGRTVTILAAVNAAEPQVGRDFADRPLVEAAIRQSLGLTYLYLGQDEQAMRQFKRTLTLRREKLGREHPDTITALYNLAYASRSAGQYADAIALFQETLQLQTKKRGRDHPDTLVTANNLARSFAHAGRLSEALPLFQDTLHRQQAIRGLDHPDTVMTMGNLAWAYDHARQLVKAVPLSSNVFRLLKDKRGADHPDTLTAMNNLALLHLQAGQTNVSFPLFQEALRLRHEKLGPDHPDTLASMHNLAGAFRTAGLLSNAVSLFEATLQLSRDKQGMDHPATLVTANNLGRTYTKAGRARDAMPLLLDTLQRQQATIGTNHSDTLITMGNLAVAHTTLGQMDKAVPLSEDVVRLLTQGRGPGDPDTLSAKGNLALAYMQAGHPENAAPVLKDVLRRRQEKQGPDHADTVGALSALVRACGAAKQFAESEQPLRDWIEQRRKTQPADDQRMADALLWLGDSLLQQGKYEEAEIPLRECETLAEPGRSMAFQIQALLGWAALGRGNHGDAERFLLQSYDGLKRRQSEQPTSARARLISETGERVLKLYEDWPRPDKSAEWRAKLEAQPGVPANVQP